MPEAMLNGSHSEMRKCVRCKILDATLVLRTEHHCKDCFLKYVSTKVLKRLESNKIRGGYAEPAKKILLPISFGVSSISLLHMIDDYLKRRHEQGRHAGVALHLLHVDCSAISSSEPDYGVPHTLKQMFPLHQFSALPLEDVFDYDIDICSILTKTNQADYGQLSNNFERLRSILLSVSSSSSRADLIGIIRRRLIAAFALKHSCTSILYGDTTTRLAERTLSETAKGRGTFLPQLTADGYIENGVFCCYPMRDLLKKEMTIYAGITEPPLSSLVLETKTSPKVVSSKDVTIEGLMQQYFESVEENYPSIVANVVRTTGKLQAPHLIMDSIRCHVCQQPVRHQHWAGDQEAELHMNEFTPQGQAETPTLCYGCTRTLQMDRDRIR